MFSSGSRTEGASDSTARRSASRPRPCNIPEPLPPLPFGSPALPSLGGKATGKVCSPYPAAEPTRVLLLWGAASVLTPWEGPPGSGRASLLRHERPAPQPGPGRSLALNSSYLRGSSAGSEAPGKPGRRPGTADRLARPWLAARRRRRRRRRRAPGKTRPAQESFRPPGIVRLVARRLLLGAERGRDGRPPAPSAARDAAAAAARPMPGFPLGRCGPLALPGFCCLPAACPGSACCAAPRGIFGQRLEDTVCYEKKFGQHLVPLLVEQCVDFLRARGLTEEGLFRLPGQANLVKDLQDSFDSRKKPQFDRNTDVHAVASLLKRYLRELPEPVVPFANYEDFLSCGQLLSKDEGEGTWELTKQVGCLPQANYNLLKFICRFLHEVQSYASHNKMSVQNLATVFGPNILRPQIEDPVTQMEGTSLVQGLMAILISEHGKIFDPTLTQDSLQPEVDLQCPPSWVDGNLPSGWTENSLCSRVGSLPALRPSAAKPCMQDCNQEENSTQPPISPSRRKQGLSPWKGSPLEQQGAGSFYHPPRSSFLESYCLSSWENRLVDGRSAVQGHCGGQGKDSDSCQRLSIYDNVPLLHLSDGVCSHTSPSCSISSSGLSLTVDSVAPCATCKTRACLALNLLPKEHPPGSPLPQGEVPLESSSGEPEACCSRSRDECNLSFASRDAIQCSEALHDLIAELKAELQKQRSEYDTTFKRMEEASAELRKLATRLEEELVKQKKKQTVLEKKLRNSEQARKDAEERNHLLQEEMAYFFTTLGNITAGSQWGKA
ncbi:rho GTPase-activating protein 22 [Crotalus adamanteus]|uniref:Rho GTPase-activating protein 22 n=1 Tax=Crotalus adamanteus TaxID=8729 RepID=A0AAW1BI08_CROAD